MTTLKNAQNNAERHRSKFIGKTTRVTQRFLNAQVKKVASLRELPNQQTLRLLVRESDTHEMLTEIWDIVSIPTSTREYNLLIGKGKKDFVGQSATAFLFRFAHKRITGITNTTKTKIIAIIAAAQKQGFGVEKIMRILVKEMRIINRVRARMIAQTELISSYNHGALQGALATGLQLNKIWQTSGNSNVRDAHTAAQGQTVDINKDFQVGNEDLSYPGDPKGRAENTINCHCASLHVRP